MALVIRVFCTLNDGNWEGLERNLVSLCSSGPRAIQYPASRQDRRCPDVQRQGSGLDAVASTVFEEWQ